MTKHTTHGGYQQTPRNVKEINNETADKSSIVNVHCPFFFLFPYVTFYLLAFPFLLSSSAGLFTASDEKGKGEHWEGGRMQLCDGLEN